MRRVRAAKPKQLIAYDFETSRIAVGTPKPLYLTAYSESPAYALQTPIRDLQHLAQVLEREFLTPEFDGIYFVAWNANNFDAYFIASALLLTDDYVIRPFLTKTNTLRGMLVEHRHSSAQWYFLDGMAMLGLATVSLEKFLINFAPGHQKLKGVIDFEGGEEFNPGDKRHCEYAMQDSIGLWHGMARAQRILLDHFNQPLTATIGNACIKIFKAHMPTGSVLNPVIVPALPDAVETLIREYVMRGGYCYCVKRYQGPVWKYDLNQAYAAAMREARLPADAAMYSARGLNPFAVCYIARVRGSNARNLVPFYYRASVNHRLLSLFGTTEIQDTWLTSIEIEQLQREGWELSIGESWAWPGYFNMRDFVDRLETLRANCDGGPSGATGTMVKAVGNHAYGKTVSQSPGETFLLAKERPPGYAPYYADGVAPIEHVWFAHEDAKPKDYEQPHIGAFITAHVRMVVRRAALLSPRSWLYADTDCVVFSSDVTALLDTHAKRYGAWKVEESGTEYRIIAKKVYQNVESGKGNAKGLRVRSLTPKDFEDWYEGMPPEQTQVQRNNFVKVMAGEEMFRSQTRRGTAVGK